MPPSIQRVMAEVLENLVVPPPRPLDLNPFLADRDALVAFGYPRRPPPDNKRAFRIWKALVTGTPKNAAGIKLGPADYQLNFASLNFPGRQETSQNWSGGVTRTGDIQTIYGEFEVPAFSSPVGVNPGRYRCSTWIGIDGHDPTSMSMPQIGVTMTVDVGTGTAPPSCLPWFQWWSRTFRLLPVAIPGVPVKPGDTIACSIHIVAPTTVNLVLQNSTAPGQPTFAMQLDARYYLGGNFYVEVDPVTGTTGEWIAERPTDPATEQRFPLPAFDSVRFDVAMVAGSDGLRKDPGPMRIIRMVEPATSVPGRDMVLSRAYRDLNGNGDSAVVVGPRLVTDLTG